MDVPEQEQKDLIQLRRNLTRYFSVGELKVLLFELGLAPDLFLCEEKEVMAMEIVHYHYRRETIGDLLQCCERHRPRISWSWTHPNSVPLLGCIGAGQVDLRPLEEWSNSEDWISIPPTLHYQVSELFALRVQGNSMVDANIEDGDIIILRYQPTVENGQIAAIWIKEEEVATLKRLYCDGSGRVELRPVNSANTKLKPTVKLNDEIIVYGKPVMVMRVYTS